jgi:hypothetical protein
MDPENSEDKPKGLVQKVKANFKDHLASSTAVNVVATPTLALFETYGVGMSDDLSINARLLGIGVVYAGIGYLVSKTRDLSRRLFKIYDTTKEQIQIVHDAAHLVAFNAVTGPFFYLAAGSRDWKEILAGTATVCALSIPMGPAMGYTIDLFKDLTGIKGSKRVPEVIRRQPGKVKKTLFALTTAAALALTAGVYLTTDEGNVTDTPLT